MTRVAPALPALLVAALLLAGPAAHAAAPAPDGPAAGAPRYVALGDSSAAGGAAGAVDPASGECRRSTLAYPELLARETGEDHWSSQACTAPRAGSGNAQFDALGPDTRLVTAGVGADAARLGELARACSGVGTVADCDAAGADTDTALAALPRALDTALGELRDRAPTAVLALVGVPRPAEGRACAVGPADGARAARLDAAAERLDAVLAERARAWGGTFVDVQGAFAGHGVCADEPWLTPLTGPDPRGAGAATAAGHAQGYVPALRATVRTALTPAPVPPASAVVG